MTAIATIPPAITKATVPKPTKAEIIEAAAQREYSKRLRIYQEEKMRCENLVSDFSARILAYAVENIEILKHSACIKIGYGHQQQGSTAYTGVHGLSVSLQYLEKGIPEKLRKEMIAYHNRPAIRWPCLKSIRAEVRAALSGHQPADKQARINALLTDAKSSKAIDAMLKAAFEKPKTPTIAAASST